jgi:O-antigen/teichoic acid export membrane protein
MPPLMLQGQARLSLVLRQLFFLATIAVLAMSGRASVVNVLTLELTAAALGWIVAYFALSRFLRTLDKLGSQEGWREPDLADQWRVALRMYAAQLITLAYSPQIFLNLIQRMLGAEAAALFGFLRILYEQVARYLPATLLFTVIRPKLMASFVSGGMKELTGHANLAGKLSYFVLMPLIVVVALGGDQLLALLSGNKFTSGGLLLLGLLLAMVPYSQRQLIESVAVAVGRSGLCTLGAAVALLALPVMLGLLELGLGLWAPVLAIMIGEAIFNAMLLAGLARLGYRPDWVAALKFTASAVLAWLATAWLPTGGRAGNVIWLTVACALALVVYLAAAWWTKPFAKAERQRLNTLAGRRILAG